MLVKYHWPGITRWCLLHSVVSVILVPKVYLPIRTRAISTIILCTLQMFQWLWPFTYWGATCNSHADRALTSYCYSTTVMLNLTLYSYRYLRDVIFTYVTVLYMKKHCCEYFKWIMELSSRVASPYTSTCHFTN